MGGWDARGLSGLALHIPLMSVKTRPHPSGKGMGEGWASVPRRCHFSNPRRFSNPCRCRIRVFAELVSLSLNPRHLAFVVMEPNNCVWRCFVFAEFTF